MLKKPQITATAAKIKHNSLMLMSNNNLKTQNTYKIYTVF